MFRLQDYGALTERQTALIMYEALQTVAACHQARIYHGDIKPANFMLANALPERSISGELEKCGFLLRLRDHVVKASASRIPCVITSPCCVSVPVLG